MTEQELKARALQRARQIRDGATIRLVEDPTSGLWHRIHETMDRIIGALPAAQGAELATLAAQVAITRLVAEAN